MKTMIRSALLICFLAIPGSLLLAQAITVTPADVQAELAIGTTINRTTDSVTSALDIGKRGATSWRFDSLKTSGTWVFTSVAAAGTPWAAEFPSATNSSQYQGNLQISISGITGTLKDVFLYTRFDANRFMGLGLRGTVQEIPGVIGRWVRIPADTMYALPMAMDSAWTSTYKEALRAENIPIFGSYSKVLSHVAKSTVDAWGPMTMPDGKSYDALRIRTDDQVTDSASGKATREISYTFLTKIGVRVRFKAFDSTQADSGLIKVAQNALATVEWESAVIPTDVAVPAALPSVYSVQQNYPNPFNPTTTIRYTVPQRAPVSLVVYNLLGQQVAQLVSGERERGTYEVRFDASVLPSGTYFYRLAAGSFVETRRMMLVK